MAQTTASSVDSLDTSKVHFIGVEGIRTRYYEDGQGEPLVLLHGGHFGFVDSLDCWSLNLKGLAQDFRVLAPDKLGQGHTDNPHSDADYSFDALLRHTIAWLKAVGVTQGAHLVGHSRGGLLAAALAFEVPGLARTVIPVDSSTLAPDDPRYPGGVFYDEIERRIPPGPPTRDTVRMEPDENSYSTAHVTDDLMDRYMEIALSPRNLEAQARLKELRHTVWMPSLARTKARVLERIDQQGMPAPTLLVWGFNDPSAPLPLGHSLFARICARTPKAQMHVFNQAGHYTFREHPEAFNRLLAAFCLG